MLCGHIHGVLPPGAWTMRVAAAGIVDSSWTDLIDPAGVMVPNSQGVTSLPPTDVPLGGNWNQDAVLLLRWIDDNAGRSSPDQIIGLDNVNIAAAVADTDGDGLPDQWELANGTNPGIADVDSDLDADGLPALLDFAFGTNGAAADAGPLEMAGGNLLARRGTPVVDLGPGNAPGSCYAAVPTILNSISGTGSSSAPTWTCGNLWLKCRR